MKPQLTAIDHIAVTVADIPTCIAFYEAILGMAPTSFTATSGETRWALCFGNMKINLHQHGAEFEPKAQNTLPGSTDLCFLTDTELNVWTAHFAAHDIGIEEGPVRRTGATGPIMSLYIRDPDGNLIEIGTRI